MPGIVPPQTPHYTPAPSTKELETLDYAELPIIDLSKTDTYEGRQALAKQVHDAMMEHGFFSVVNHGYTTAQTERIFDIADIPFARVGENEKKVYVANMKEQGSYQGYKPRVYWHIEGGVRDQVEHYNVNRDVSKRQHPEVLRPFLPEISEFARRNHEDVLHPILRLLALGLELPEETLVKLHGYSTVGESSVRFMKYYPRSEDEEAKTKNVWLKGHTDFGTITILYSQPIAALQILSKDGSWKWVRHIENSLVINAGDALTFLTGGYYKATIHRVVQPPPSQRNHTRLGVFYFCMTNDDVELSPLVESPVLQRIGVYKSGGNTAYPTMETWRKGRTVAYGQSVLKPAENSSRIEEEIINGVVVRHYN